MKKQTIETNTGTRIEFVALSPRDYDEVVLTLDKVRRGVTPDGYAVTELLERLGEAPPETKRCVEFQPSGVRGLTCYRCGLQAMEHLPPPETSDPEGNAR